MPCPPNKMMFGTRDEAEKFLKTAKRAKHANTFDLKKLRVYQCPSCTFFHLTSTIKKHVKRRRKQRKRYENA